MVMTHDLVRKNDGRWRCVNCGRIGTTIGGVNRIRCTDPAPPGSNLIAAIEGTGPFAVRRRVRRGGRTGKS